jgi:succinate dehydrogenase/fumarate reductase flavoprotein subunit
LNTCLLVARAALERNESRGCHLRDDCMAMDNERWLKNIYLHKDSNGAMAMHTESVHVTTIDPREVIDERPHINS